MNESELCSECPYYNGKSHYTAKNIPPLVEQCGIKYLQEHGIEYHVKYGKSKNVICVIEQDYQYMMFLHVGEYNRLEKVLITKEEYDSFYEWENDTHKVQEITNRILGCGMCRNAVIIHRPETCLKQIGESMKRQAKLMQCKECGTVWEYGVYNCSVVYPTYINHYYKLG